MSTIWEFLTGTKKTQNIVDEQKEYSNHNEAVIISCFYNPENNPYRLLAFHKWYKSIKHLNHRIIECLIGPNAKSQLPKSKFITQINTDSLLWHKETLLNKIISELPYGLRYVFWIDADVLFTNKNWLVESVEKLKLHCNILQPFEYCIHLEKDQIRPEFDVNSYRTIGNERLHKSLWRSFCSNYKNNELFNNINYDIHGHVGFAWGARREILTKCPLFDKALIGGADHIIAHAAAGQIPHECIRKSFVDNIKDVEDWSNKFYAAVRGKIGYVKGDLYHIWHGNLKDRQYLKRIKEFTLKSKNLTKDSNGLYKGKDNYIKNYFKTRERVGFSGSPLYESGSFERDMGYNLLAMAYLFNNSTYENNIPEEFEDNQAIETVPFEPIEEKMSEHVEFENSIIINELLEQKSIEFTSEDVVDENFS